MRWLPASLGLVGAAAMTAALLLPSCQSDSETPNAYWGLDGGVAGDIGNPCRSNSRCNDAVAVCIDEDANDGEPPICRTGCSASATNDPCGVGLRCVGIQDQGDNGACLPAPALGETCVARCDDGLVCVTTSQDGGSQSQCATECEDDTDCDSPQTCDPEGFCA